MEQPVKYYRNPDEPISLEDLKSFLWGAATRLRGQIDAAGYKEYIFPLLFFKRISDVYDEQFEGYVCEGGIEYANAQAQELVIRIPDGAHWRDVRECTENVGQRLVEAFIAIEQANPGEHADGRVIGGLEGIFGPKDGWTNKAKMPDHIITSLIEDFSRYNLSLKACPADEMGQAYEYLVGKFADDAGNTAQEFYTNRTVVDLMAEILQPRPGESIYDPTCGSGGMLVKCLDFLRKKGEPWQGVKVFGQEINALTSAIARMNLYLNGVEDFSIVREDTLAYPAFVDGSKLRKFDIVLANPPYSIKTWDREAFINDKWGRNFLGTPPQSKADYAFIQHILSSMNDHGSAIARMNLYLNGVEDFSIVREDTLAYPAFVDGSKLRKFDIVLANPPYSIKTWDREAFINDKWGRNFLGTPPQSKADYAFIQHILSSMNDHGRCAILLPHGVLNRLIEKDIRQKLIQNDLIDAVISIGKNLFFNSPMEACILICRSNKPTDRKNKILLIKATDLVERKNTESYLTNEHISIITSIYTRYTNIDGRSKIINNNEIPDNKYSISPKFYVKSNDPKDIEDISELLENWKSNSESLHESFTNLIDLL